MLRLTVKQLELAHVGIIRENMVSNTIVGKIYRAQLVFGDEEVKVLILYKKNGKGILLCEDPFQKDKGSNRYENFINMIYPILPFPDFKTLFAIRAGIYLSFVITIFNLLRPLRDVSELFLNILDVIGVVALIVLYIKERERYVVKE